MRMGQGKRRPSSGARKRGICTKERKRTSLGFEESGKKRKVSKIIEKTSDGIGGEKLISPKPGTGNRWGCEAENTQKSPTSEGQFARREKGKGDFDGGNGTQGGGTLEN